MNADHTPEPWFTSQQGRLTIYIESRIGGGMLQEVAACGPTEAGREQQEANADRIVACVNACAGIADPAELRRQRDELLEALQTMLDVWPNREKKPGWCKRWSEAQEQARASIANATKGTK